MALEGICSLNIALLHGLKSRVKCFQVFSRVPLILFCQFCQVEYHVTLVTNKHLVCFCDYRVSPASLNSCTPFEAMSAASDEQQYVHQVYDHIASHFSDTRYKVSDSSASRLLWFTEADLCFLAVAFNFRLP